ncbi:MAG: hypothetical protein WCI05_08785 [Myxococcales bacterium]
MPDRRPIVPWAMPMVAITLCSGLAYGWQEAHLTSDQVRFCVDRAAQARVEHAFGVQVIRGPLRTFDIDGIAPEAVLDPSVVVAGEDGRTLAGHAERREDLGVRVTLEEPRAITRGKFVIHVVYGLDLAQTPMLSRDGALWRLVWTSPRAPEGIDAMRVTFEFPPGPTEPRPVHPDTGVFNTTALSTVRRTPEHDALDIVRPHVARGEAAVWSVRLDPKAFPEVKTPRLLPGPPPPPARTDRVRELAVALGLVALGGTYALLLWLKERAYSRLAEARNATVRGLLPLASPWRALLAASCLVAGVALELAGRPTLGALCVVGAMVLGALRAPVVRGCPRGPGQWLPLRSSEAFVRAGSPDQWLDITTRKGQGVLLFMTVALGLLGWLLGYVDPQAPYLVALNGAALVPLLATGLGRQLPPDPATAPVPILQALYARLQGNQTLRVVPWGRIPTGSGHADELRLLVLPRVPVQGLVGIEIGVAWNCIPSGHVGVPEVLVRMLDGSKAASRMRDLAPWERVVPGRRPEERVVSLRPSFDTPEATAELVEELGQKLSNGEVPGASRSGLF